MYSVIEQSYDREFRIRENFNFIEDVFGGWKRKEEKWKTEKRKGGKKREKERSCTYAQQYRHVCTHTCTHQHTMYVQTVFLKRFSQQNVQYVRASVHESVIGCVCCCVSVSCHAVCVLHLDHSHSFCCQKSTSKTKCFYTARHSVSPLRVPHLLICSSAILLSQWFPSFRTYQCY